MGRIFVFGRKLVVHDSRRSAAGFHPVVHHRLEVFDIAFVVCPNGPMARAILAAAPAIPNLKTLLV